jgi:hypothetical protein
VLVYVDAFEALKIPESSLKDLADKVGKASVTC